MLVMIVVIIHLLYYPKKVMSQGETDTIKLRYRYMTLE